ncbi:Sulfotransferase family protein [Parapedobacter indicus]|uniref:Sulfotransferase family protein n=2 Tax=Parapedobacter indicus TaxID=1477437 RepID=A0A1I3HSN2_9SPHI|nr:sulfotransferase family protein [Parapedobacter indicus]SFI38692.1 Sulfotransferase family protein [Parapedobacter indicus]
MGNFFCIIPNTGVAFVAISKNAVTFLKKVAYYNGSREKVWEKGFTSVHDLIGYSDGSPYLVPVDKMQEFENKHGVYTKFAVWRDPIERIVSTYKLFCLDGEFRRYFHFLGLVGGTSFDRFVDFLEFEWEKKDPLWQDEHIRRQVDYYNPSEVNYIVNIHNLHSFLTDFNVPFKSEISNKTLSSFELTNEKHLTRIRQYYKADYQIECNYEKPD